MELERAMPMCVILIFFIYRDSPSSCVWKQRFWNVSDRLMPLSLEKLLTKFYEITMFTFRFMLLSKVICIAFLKYIFWLAHAFTGNRTQNLDVASMLKSMSHANQIGLSSYLQYKRLLIHSQSVKKSEFVLFTEVLHLHTAHISHFEVASHNAVQQPLRWTAQHRGDQTL